MIWICGHSKWQIKDVLQKKWRCAFVPFVFVCVSYILCSGMWNIDFKKKKNSDLPTLFFFLCYANQTIFFLRLTGMKNYGLLTSSRPNISKQQSGKQLEIILLNSFKPKIWIDIDNVMNASPSPEKQLSSWYKLTKTIHSSVIVTLISMINLWPKLYFERDGQTQLLCQRAILKWH